MNGSMAENGRGKRVLVRRYATGGKIGATNDPVT